MVRVNFSPPCTHAVTYRIPLQKEKEKKKLLKNPSRNTRASTPSIIAISLSRWKQRRFHIFSANSIRPSMSPATGAQG